MKKILLLAVLLISQIGFAQELDNEKITKVKAKLFQAEEYYENGENSKAFAAIKKLDRLTGGRKSAILQVLKIKILMNYEGDDYFSDGRIKRGASMHIFIAKFELEELYKLNPSNELIKEIIPFANKIDEMYFDARVKHEDVKRIEFNEEKVKITSLKLMIDMCANSMYAFFDNNGEMIIPPIYSTGRNFSEGLAYVENHKGKGGFINSKGEVVIPFQYTNAMESFHNGKAKVNIDSGEFFYIDKKGNRIN